MLNVFLHLLSMFQKRKKSFKIGELREGVFGLYIPNLISVEDPSDNPLITQHD